MKDTTILGKDIIVTTNSTWQDQNSSGGTGMDTMVGKDIILLEADTW